MRLSPLKSPTSPLCANGVARACINMRITRQKSTTRRTFKSLQNGKPENRVLNSALAVYCLLNQRTQIAQIVIHTMNAYAFYMGQNLEVMHLSMSSPKGGGGGGIGHRVGILTFSKKKIIKIPTPGQKIIGSLSKSLRLALIRLPEVNFPQNETLRMYVGCIHP